jgi:hypothetical protein
LAGRPAGHIAPLMEVVPLPKNVAGYISQCQLLTPLEKPPKQKVPSWKIALLNLRASETNAYSVPFKSLTQRDVQQQNKF